MRRPDPKEPLRFGDIFETTWFYDASLRQDSVLLTKVDGNEAAREPEKKIDWYHPAKRRKNTPAEHMYATAVANEPALFDQAPPTDTEREDEAFALAFGEPRIRSIVLTDDCAIRKALGRKAGRILMAPLVGLENADPGTSHVSWARHRLEPVDEVEFQGGYVELARAIPVYSGALEHARRILSLDPDEALPLSAQWCAHATRHGPVVSHDGARKLFELMRVGTDTAQLAERKAIELTPAQSEAHRSLTQVLAQFWKFEGQVLDEVSDAHEERRTDDDAAQLVLQELEALTDATRTALEALRRSVA